MVSWIQCLVLACMKEAATFQGSKSSIKTSTSKLDFDFGLLSVYLEI